MAFQLHPQVLGARTRTNKDIFYNAREGLPRADRELAAAATSREHGCVFCASVHARFASHYSDRHDDVQRLLDDGSAADLGPRWNAVNEGLDALELADVIHGAAFFNWANRLMLSLGEPEQ